MDKENDEKGFWDGLETEGLLLMFALIALIFGSFLGLVLYWWYSFSILAFFLGLFGGFLFFVVIITHWVLEREK